MRKMARGHRLATAAFADDPNRLTALDVEGQTVYGLDHTTADVELHLEVAHLQQSWARIHRWIDERLPC